MSTTSFFFSLVVPSLTMYSCSKRGFRTKQNWDWWLLSVCKSVCRRITFPKADKGWCSLVFFPGLYALIVSAKLISPLGTVDGGVDGTGDACKPESVGGMAWGTVGAAVPSLAASASA